MDTALESAEDLREVLLRQHRQITALRREVQDSEILITASNALLASAGTVDPFDTVFETLGALVGFAEALVLIEDEPTATVRCETATDCDFAKRTWPISPLLRKVLLGKAIATLPAAADSVGIDAASADQPVLYVPIDACGQRGALMLIRSASASAYDRGDIAVAQRLAPLAAHALATRRAAKDRRERQRLEVLTRELREAQELLTQRANSDPLTGLSNRAYFEERVNQVIREAQPDRQLTVAFIDLDGFKQVNDRYGHEVGDQLLIAVAGRLRAHTRNGDLLARISGDEFVALFNPQPDTTTADSLFKRILADLKSPFIVDGLHLHISASIGLATFPDHGDTYEQLRKNADRAMYQAKNTSRGSMAFYEHAIGIAADQRADHEQRLRQAVTAGRFTVVLQPQIDIYTGAITGFEALARQIDDDGSLIPAAEFIDLASQLGLLDEITTLVLADLTKELPRLDAAFGEHTTISLNLSSRQVTDPAVLRRIIDLLPPGVARKRFIIEITEDALLNNTAFHQHTLPLLTEAGLQISIDDFGTGYTSLSRMLSISANEIKIDRSFISMIHERPRSQSMLQAVTAIGQELGMSIVVEGVELPEELNHLRSHTDLMTVQGYLFAEPQPIEHLIETAPTLTDHIQQLLGLPGQPVLALPARQEGSRRHRLTAARPGA